MRKLLLLVSTVLIIPAFASAQNVEVKIEINESTGSIVRVTGRIEEHKTRYLSFIRAVSGFDKLGERISAMVLKDKNGKVVNYQMPIPGEFIADSDIAEFSYLLDLAPRKEQNAAAHVSWLTKDAGVLMLGDMLPRIGMVDEPNLGLTLVIPRDWETTGPIKHTSIAKPQDAVFYLVRKFGIQALNLHGSSAMTVRSGEWQFSDGDLATAVAEIFFEYQKILGNELGHFKVGLFKFPNATQPGQWQAETRGRNITIVSSDMAFKTQSIQRLHEQLRHEMFHLWIPNGVNLSGNYDWFYEGFALYQSLKTAVALNRIRFDDFLDTLSRAQAIDARQTIRLSLIDASNKRWSGADTYIYARGMVTAFLIDLHLLNASKGKRSVENLLRDLFSKHRFPAVRTDGNTAILELMSRNPELATVVERYIKGDGKFEWSAELAFAGLESKNGLSVIAKPSGRQKDLLDRLGYNNWKRSSR